LAGHSAASAHHYYENILMDEVDQIKLADHSTNPKVNDMVAFYSIRTNGQWTTALYYFRSRMTDYYDKYSTQGGEALFQKFEKFGDSSEVSDFSS